MRDRLGKESKLFNDNDPRLLKVPSTRLSLGDKLLMQSSLPTPNRSNLVEWTTPLPNPYPHPILRLQLPATLPTLASRLNCGDMVDDDFLLRKLDLLWKLKCWNAGGMDGLPEHLQYGGPLLTIWLKQIFKCIHLFCAHSCCILTGIIHPIYKIKGNDPIDCRSFRVITMMSIL